MKNGFLYNNQISWNINSNCATILRKLWTTYGKKIGLIHHDLIQYGQLIDMSQYGVQLEIILPKYKQHPVW